MAGTFQNLSGGRLLLNVVTGGESHEQRMYGDFLDKDARYARCDEFLDDRPPAVGGETGDVRGRAPRVEDAVLAQIPDPLPEIYFGGSSPARTTSPPKHADVYLTWGEPPAAVAEKVEGSAGSPPPGSRAPLRHPAAHDRPRHLRGGVGRGRPPARRDLRRRDRRVQAGLRAASRRGSAGCSTSTAARARGLEIHPNLWAGVGLVRGGAGTALVGSHEEIADRIEEYAAVGIDEFVRLSRLPRTSRRRTGSARACCPTAPALAAPPGWTPPLRS
jgi:alkanesulfonate monooxygenase